MGQTLENGVYLPSEGERNCYAGLKTNWEILDQKVADVTALQQAVAGALHREIVESLPTTDINPNTIYMILSGTSATENVYNEFMYVNNAWELIGTSATDLTNYYTKAEVDGKLLLKANASDLTSHTGDTTIHVTTADKNKWNNQTYVFRYSSTALVASSTNSNSLLDNTDNLKVGDKVIDSDGVLFSITAIDTVNSTFTIGSALIDLALDANVVHASGNETITGTKTLDNVDLPFKNSAELGVSGGSTNITFSDKNGQLLCALKAITYSSGVPSFLINLTQKVDNTIYTTNGIVVYQSANSKVIQVRPTLANDNVDGLKVELGSSANRYNRIYGLAYYYGSDNVEFSTKFVTTDTAQTISGAKTFSSSPVIYNSDTTATAPQILFKNSKTARGSTTETGAQLIYFADKNNIGLGMIENRVISNGSTSINIVCYNTDADNNTVSGGISIIKSPTNTNFAPTTDNAVTCGRALAKWSDVQTYKVNSLTPSALSLPSTSDNAIDISSYFTNFNNGETNQYSPTVNGWIYLETTGCNALHCFCTTTGYLVHYGNTVARTNDGMAYVTFPVLANTLFKCTWYTNSTITLSRAWFIPCQGNV